MSNVSLEPLLTVRAGVVTVEMPALVARLTTLLKMFAVNWASSLTPRTWIPFPRTPSTVLLTMCTAASTEPGDERSIPAAAPQPHPLTPETTLL